jgi:hypothetical protein
MTRRLGLLAALPAAALLLGVPTAHASTFMGSPDASAEPEAFACAALCAPGTTVVFRQFALRGATLEAPEDGVLVSAAVHAKRIAGEAQPQIAVLRPEDEEEGGVTIAGSAPIAVSSPTGETAEVEDLHLPVKSGDSIGLIVPAGQVDLGVRARRRPDGAVQRSPTPCDPCAMDGGTGTELLFSAVLEPDVDEDGLGDESQDPDGGGLGLDWEDDWFDDYGEGDELDEDEFDEDLPRRARPLRLLDVDRRGRRGTTLLVRVPRAGRLSAAITLPADRTGAGPFTTIFTGDRRVHHAGRVRLRLVATPPGSRALERRRRLRTKVVVSLVPRRANLTVLMRSARL